MIRRWLLWILRDDLKGERRLLEIEAEWNELLTKMSAQVARDAKAKKRAVTKALDGETERPPPAPHPQDRKALLRQRAARVRGLSVVGGGFIPETEADDVAGGQDS